MCTEDSEAHVNFTELGDVILWVERTNAFEVMGELKRLGVLTSEDINKAGTMDRKSWLDFMFDKIGIGGL